MSLLASPTSTLFNYSTGSGSLKRELSSRSFQRSERIAIDKLTRYSKKSTRAAAGSRLLCASHKGGDVVGSNAVGDGAAACRWRHMTTRSCGDVC
eukprot:3741-Heterococcus_DN1.PRE.3